MKIWREVKKDDKVISSIGSKWIFKVKYDENGSVSRFKARIVARGFSQIEGVDYNETYSPTLKMESLRYLLAFAHEKNYACDQVDVETAFLQGDLDDDLFLRLPSECGNESKKTVKLLKPLYGAKQSPRCWNMKLVSSIASLGFKQSQADPCVFLRFEKSGDVSVIAFFVDDIIFLGLREIVDELKMKLMGEFKSRDLGPIKFILSIQVDRTENELRINQSHYIDQLLEKYGLTDCKPQSTPLPPKICSDSKEALTKFDDVSLYQSMIGSLIYLSNSTRPDISYSVSVLASKMASPSVQDYILVKRVLRYLKGTKDLDLVFHSARKLEGFSDASYAEEEGRKSRTGLVYTMNGAAICWKSKKQRIVALSSMEAEYIALTSSMNEGVWVKRLEEELRRENSCPIIINEDNQSSIKLASNPIYNERSKHIDVRYHYIREMIEKKEIKLKYIPTNLQTADILTKGLTPEIHRRHVRGLGLIRKSGS